MNLQRQIILWRSNLFLTMNIGYVMRAIMYRLKSETFSQL